MKISQLQELLTRAEKTYGDLDVNVLKRSNAFGSNYRKINTAEIVRISDYERVEIGDPLSELGKPILHLDYLPPEDKEDD